MRSHMGLQQPPHLRHQANMPRAAQREQQHQDEALRTLKKAVEMHAARRAKEAGDRGAPAGHAPMKRASASAPLQRQLQQQQPAESQFQHQTPSIFAGNQDYRVGGCGSSQASQPELSQSQMCPFPSPVAENALTMSQQKGATSSSQMDHLASLSTQAPSNPCLSPQPRDFSLSQGQTQTQTSFRTPSQQFSQPIFQQHQQPPPMALPPQQQPPFQLALHSGEQPCSSQQETATASQVAVPVYPSQEQPRYAPLPASVVGANAALSVPPGAPQMPAPTTDGHQPEQQPQNAQQPTLAAVASALAQALVGAGLKMPDASAGAGRTPATHASKPSRSPSRRGATHRDKATRRRSREPDVGEDRDPGTPHVPLPAKRRRLRRKMPPPPAHRSPTPPTSSLTFSSPQEPRGTPQTSPRPFRVDSTRIKERQTAATAAAAAAAAVAAVSAAAAKKGGAQGTEAAGGKRTASAPASSRSSDSGDGPGPEASGLQVGLLGLATEARDEALNGLRRELRKANEEHLALTTASSQIVREVQELVAEYQQVCTESETALAMFSEALQRAGRAADSMGRGSVGASAVLRGTAAPAAPNAVSAWPFPRAGGLLVAQRRRCIDGISLQPRTGPAAGAKA